MRVVDDHGQQHIGKIHGFYMTATTKANSVNNKTAMRQQHLRRNTIKEAATTQPETMATSIEE